MILDEKSFFTLDEKSFSTIFKKRFLFISCRILFQVSELSMTKKSLILTLFLTIISKRADCLDDIIGNKVDGAYILQLTIWLITFNNPH